MSLVEVLNNIKKKGVDIYKIRKVIEEYERFSVYVNDYITKSDMIALILNYHFPSKDELYNDILTLLSLYMDTVERMPMDDKKRFIDLIIDYLDHR